MISVVRTDTGDEASGWGMNLQFECCPGVCPLGEGVAATDTVDGCLSANGRVASGTDDDKRNGMIVVLSEAGLCTVSECQGMDNAQMLQMCADTVTCTDTDGCADSPCFESDDGAYSSTCQDEPAPSTGFTCDACPDGFNGDGEVCSDINDCANDPCGSAAAGTCSDTGANSYECSCSDGYTDTSGECSEVLPCENSENDCDANAVCSHVGPGEHSSACTTGYSGDGTQCDDTDGCADSPCFESDDGAYSSACFDEVVEEYGSECLRRTIERVERVTAKTAVAVQRTGRHKAWLLPDDNLTERVQQVRGINVFPIATLEPCFVTPLCRR